jgi:hypothetical protein
MGIWATIGESAATMGGDQEGAAKFAQQRTDQASAHDQYRQDRLKKAEQAGNTLQKMIAMLTNGADPNLAPLPGKEQQVAMLRSRKKQLEQYIQNLSNPKFDPMKGTAPQGFWGKQKPVPGVAEGSAVAEQYETDGLGVPSAETPANSELPVTTRKIPPLPLPEVKEPPHEYSPEVISQAETWKRLGVKPTAKNIAEAERYLDEKHPGWKMGGGSDKWRPSGAPYQKDGEWYQAEVSPSGSYRETKMPKGFQGKPTSVQVAADKDYITAVKLDSIANQVAQKPDDAINQKRLAVALERISAGRFTTQALDYIIKAGWGNTIEQWANNPSTGALPKDVLRQLVDGAHENLKAAKDARDEARSESNVSAPTKPGEQKKELEDKVKKTGESKEIHYKIVNGELVPQN